MSKKRIFKIFKINLVFNFLVQYSLQFGQLIESNQLKGGVCDQSVVNQLKAQNLNVFCDADLQIIVDMHSSQTQNINLYYYSKFQSNLAQQCLLQQLNNTNKKC
ncbi:hypothetical protein ABPG72_018771 [Tetrahymena utriculariae]